jgi:putative NADH-flavin reductase
MKRALILGATGLVGNALLNLLLESDRYSEVVAVVRNPLAIAHPKLHVILTESSMMYFAVWEPPWQRQKRKRIFIG